MPRGVVSGGVVGVCLLLGPSHLQLIRFRHTLGVRYILLGLRLRMLRCKQPFIQITNHPLLRFLQHPALSESVLFRCQVGMRG